jgi:hypothetical protein
MSEVEATKAFLKYKKYIIKQLGKKALDDLQILRLAKELLGKKFIGVYAQDKLPIKTGYYVINTDLSKTINSDSAHWVGIYQTPKTLFIYDSYGRNTSYVLPLIYKNTKKKIIESRKDPEQYGQSALCGQLSICFLCVIHDLGIRKALTI